MARVPRQYAEHFKALNRLRNCYKQEKKTDNRKYVESVIQLLSKLIENCESSQRILRSQGEEHTIGYQQLTDLIVACREGLTRIRASAS